MTGMNDKKFMALFVFAAYGALSLVGVMLYLAYWCLEHVRVVVR